MITMSMVVIDNTDKTIQAIKAALTDALVEIGGKMENTTKRLVLVDTGNLRGKITFDVDALQGIVTIGTNVEYAPYVEFGTGLWAEDGGGRQDGWQYMDAEGNWHFTYGQPPMPFIRPAVEFNREKVKTIFERHFGKLGGL